MIERRPNPADRRAYQLFLTDTARPLVNSFRALGTGCVTDALAGVSEEEIRLVTDVLSRIRTNILAMPDVADGEPDAPKPASQTDRSGSSRMSTEKTAKNVVEMKAAARNRRPRSRRPLRRIRRRRRRGATVAASSSWVRCRSSSSSSAAGSG